MNECLKRAANTYRRLTARRRTLTHFLIIGPMQGGTTSPVNYLYRHPCVVRPQLPRFQEMHFFRPALTMRAARGGTARIFR